MIDRRLLALLTLATGFVVALQTASAEEPAPSIGLIALDPVTAGNGATQLGPRDGCRRVERGAFTDVDLVVDSIPETRPAIAFQVDVKYDPRTLEVTGYDVAFLLASVGAYEPFPGLSDPLPDRDGSFRVSVLDIESRTDPPANVESGAGVLARISFRAKAEGTSRLTVDFNPRVGIYPAVQDIQNQTIEVNSLGGAALSVGRDCPPGAMKLRTADLPSFDQLLRRHGGASPSNSPHISGRTQ